MAAHRLSTLEAFASGAVGASVLTALHETARHVLPQAPRVDLLGMQVLVKALRAADLPVPDRDNLHHLTLAGDLSSNALYYSLVGAGEPKHVWLRGALLGAAAGLGALATPKLTGLNERLVARTATTAVLTFTWYLAGGLAAAATAHLLARRTS